MKNLYCLISLFFLLCCFLSLVLSFSPSNTHLPKYYCLDDQRYLLLQLQQHLYYADSNFAFSSKFDLWDLNTDCCSWKGVTCDALGHVIGLDLSYESLSGNFHSVFDLHHLQRLNLAGNNFNTTLLSYGFDKLLNLTHLNLSSSCFQGQIPMEISYLTRLVSLDLSCQQYCYVRNAYNPPTLKLEKPNLKTLIKSMKSLSELYLDGVDISSESSTWCETISSMLSNLQVLSLLYCSLEGPLCSSISTLPFLSELLLGGNSISYLPPNFLENSSHLVSLNLVNCNLSGHFPTEIFLLPNIQSIHISNNVLLTGQLPEFPSNNALRSLSLSVTNFSGKLPESIGNLKFLRGLSLVGCQFFGSIPLSISNLSHLVYLDLSDNHFSGSIPNCLGNMSQLWNFDASHNNLSGQIPNCLGNMSQLEAFDVSYNNLSGTIPNCLGNMRSLSYLNLQGNKLRGIMPEFSKENQLWVLKVSENRLEGKLPRSLKECTYLRVLDVGNNMMHDTFPFWLEKLPDLLVLTLRGNRFYGQMKHLKHKVSFPALDVLDIASNQFYGELSIEFLNATQLRSLKIGENKLEGKLPTSLANCKNLEVLDLGNNKIHDTFPFWLKKLPSLKVLILRSNRFYGSITKFDFEGGFPMLRILDIASNNFSGDLSIEFIKGLKAMMQITNGDKAKLEYIGERSIYGVYYQDSVTIVNKGVKLFYEKVLTILTCIDLSNNCFHGRIPEEIHILRSLHVLNLSSNSFSGGIPLTLENLKDLESLDLSVNNLSGKIPPQLTSLTFLGAFNLSYNQLEGSIPQSNQFITFSNDSYIGNPKLCGPPLSRNCDEVGLPMPPPPGEHEKASWLDVLSIWQIVLVGYASGLVVGICLEYTVLNELGDKWVDKFKKHEKRNRRRSR